MLNDKSILITGGTGSFGRRCTQAILERYEPRKLIIFSRDELKQLEMSQVFAFKNYECLRYFIGDLRDKERVYRAFQGVDYVIHAAALKQVDTAEYNPFEAVQTNIIGAQNVINAAIDQKVSKVVALSTDQAANPANLYGATKLCADKLFIAGNAWVGREHTIFSVVRFSNVAENPESGIPFLLQQRKTGLLPIPDPRMSRFWIIPDQGVNFVLNRLEHMVGGEVFVPKIPSVNIVELAKAICPGCKTEIVGMQPGEKIHELLITRDEARRTHEFKDYYVIKPDFRFFTRRFNDHEGRPVPEDFEYNSGTNSQWLKGEDLAGSHELLHRL